MIDFDGRSKRAFKQQSATVPAKPTTCGVFGCDNETVVLIAVVTDESGRERSRPAYDVMRGDSLMDGYTWVRWVSRCAEHYTAELYAAQRGVYSNLGADRTGVPDPEQIAIARANERRNAK